MVVRKLLLSILVCHLFIAGVCSDCIPVQCLQCNLNKDLCLNCLAAQSLGGCISVPLPLGCRKEFTVNISSSTLNPSEGDEVTLTCASTLTEINLTFGWMKDGEVLDKNQSILVLPKVFSDDSGVYNCSVNSLCGNYSAQYTLSVTNGSVIVLVVCGVAALGLVLFMGLAMKFKLKRDNAKHRERRKRREQTGQNGGPAPVTPRQS